MALARWIETYPPGRRALFAASSVHVDADRFGEYARRLAAMSPEACCLMHLTATSMAQRAIIAGVDEEFALVDMFIALLACGAGEGNLDDLAKS